MAGPKQAPHEASQPVEKAQALTEDTDSVQVVVQVGGETVSSLK
jgi:hypothetical protein